MAEINSIKSSNINFGMAIRATNKGKLYLEKHLDLKGIKQIAELTESEKLNPVDVFIGTETKYMSNAHIPAEFWTKYDSFVVSVEDRKFRLSGITSLFSHSKAIMSAIKKGVKYSHELTEKRNGLKNI